MTRAIGHGFASSARATKTLAIGGARQRPPMTGEEGPQRPRGRARPGRRRHQVSAWATRSPIAALGIGRLLRAGASDPPSAASPPRISAARSLPRYSAPPTRGGRRASVRPIASRIDSGVSPSGCSISCSPREANVRARVSCSSLGRTRGTKQPRLSGAHQLGDSVVAGHRHRGPSSRDHPRHVGAERVNLDLEPAAALAQRGDLVGAHQRAGDDHGGARQGVDPYRVRERGEDLEPVMAAARGREQVAIRKVDPAPRLRAECRDSRRGGPGSRGHPIPGR